MLTKEDAINANEFHFGGCIRTVGPRGGVIIHSIRVRRNGRTQVWKTRPEEWRVPVKQGFRDAFSITHKDATAFHTAENCQLREGKS